MKTKLPETYAIRRPQHVLFRFTRAELHDREIRLGYALAGGPDPDIDFEEVLYLPEGLPVPDPEDPVVQVLLDGCHRAFGTSYFKAAVPANIEASAVSDVDADFWDALYSEGLGEFYYRNGLYTDERVRAHFPRGLVRQSGEGLTARPDSTLVLIGGGKDSALVADIVRNTGVPAAALSMGDSRWIRQSASASGLPLHVVRRALDRKLLDLNSRGAWNGHIPISTCIAFVSSLVAYAGGYANVLVGNERGAEEHNIELNGVAVNHQWSKTLRFEKSFRLWCNRHCPQGPSYFSLLRPMSEIYIARRFAKLPSQLPNFSSCNANFRQLPGEDNHRWCGRCPKCVFVCLLLSPHLDEKNINEIFGGNFLANEYNRPVLEELLGVREIKPWECVGTINESRLSFTALCRQGRLPDAAKRIAEHYPQVLFREEFDNKWNAEFILSNEHCIPEKWMVRLNDYLKTDQ